jgi:hypothetical protein
MTNISELDLLLADIGPMAIQDRAMRRQVAMEEAPEFHALAFFDSREVIVTKIVAYLLDPSAQHGQGHTFLRAFLTVLGVISDIEDQEMRHIVVQAEAQCYKLPNRRRMDILIQFSTNTGDYVVVIESKSHFARDMKNQVCDYLEHLRLAYPPKTHKYFYYLKDGSEPSPDSVSPREWEAACSAGTCKAGSHLTVMTEWLELCRKRGIAQKLKTFLNDFANFIKLDEEKPMTIGHSVRDRVLEIIEAKALARDDGSSEFDAILAIFEMRESIWEKALTLCMNSVTKELEKQLPGWTSKVSQYVRNGNTYMELRVWNQKWVTPNSSEPRLYVCFATEDCEGPTTYFDLYIERKRELSPPTRLQFDSKNCLIIGPKVGQTWKNVILNGLPDIKTVEGIRYLLSLQGCMEIAKAIAGFVQEHGRDMESCFTGRATRRSSFASRVSGSHDS